MKVNLLGFELEFAKGVSIGEFYQQLEAIEDKEIKIRSRTSVLYTNIVDNLICGLVLSYKTDKKSLITERDKDGDLKVTKNILNKNEHGTEVSLFCINPDSLRGIFYSYTGSVSPNGLADIFKKQHDVCLSQKKKSYREQLTDFGTKKIKNLSNRINNKYSGRFRLQLLATPSDLNSILSRYSDIKSVTLRATNALSEGGVFTPLDDISKQSTVTVKIKENTVISVVKNKLISVFGPYAKQKKESALRIIGLAHSGEDLSLIVGENNDNFGRLEYDDYVDLLPRDKWKDYIECEALIRIVRKVLETDVVFGNVSVDNKWKLLSAKDIKNDIDKKLILGLTEDD